MLYYSVYKSFAHNIPVTFIEYYKYVYDQLFYYKLTNKISWFIYYTILDSILFQITYHV